MASSSEVPKSNKRSVTENIPLSSLNSVASSNPRGDRNRRNVSFAPGANASTSSVQSSQRRTVQRKKGAGLDASSLKKENLMQLIQKKKECEKKAHEIVLRLIDPKVEKEYLLENAIRISKQHLEDVIEERKLSELCGWALCDNQVDPNNVPKQTYQIRRQKVYDITERKSYCSGQCYAKATHFKSQLLTSPLWLRNMEEDVHFEILEDHETENLRGISVAFSSVTLSDEESDNDNNDDTNSIPVEDALSALQNTDAVVKSEIVESS